jgi:hypothetical protein
LVPAVHDRAAAALLNDRDSPSFTPEAGPLPRKGDNAGQTDMTSKFRVEDMLGDDPGALGVDAGPAGRCRSE